MIEAERILRQFQNAPDPFDRDAGLEDHHVFDPALVIFLECIAICCHVFLVLAVAFERRKDVVLDVRRVFEVGFYFLRISFEEGKNLEMSLE